MEPMIDLGAVLLAQTAPDGVNGIHSVWDFVIKGGPTMAAIGLCSLVALAVIVERSILLRRRSVLPPQFLSSLESAAGDPARALALCQADDSPAARLLAAIFKRRGQREELIEKAVQDAGTRIMVRLRHRMRLLSALPQVSTMLGLLGTIFGMIKTFQAVAVSGQALGKTEMLARGIFEAWTNTAAGLLVAIPVLIAYHVLLGRIDAMAVELDRVAAEWIEREVSAGGPSRAAPAHLASASAPARDVAAAPLMPAAAVGASS